MEINNRDLMEDPEDLELKAVMGQQFQDLSKGDMASKREKMPEHVPAPNGEKKPEPVSQAPVEKKSQQKVMDAAWAPVNCRPTEIQRVVDCAKQALLYGGISALLFWWQQAGLLASQAAVPSFIVLALMAGLKIGSCATK